MVQVTVQDQESLDRAISRFRRKCARAGILKDFKKTTYFLKPSVKRRIRKEKAIRRAHRLARE
ncbi:MAG: 30S ribosomal protein S21 [bacterium]